jgi:hypothetical protein
MLIANPAGRKAKQNIITGSDRLRGEKWGCGRRMRMQIKLQLMGIEPAVTCIVSVHPWNCHC